ncbi:MAG: glycosyltransferase family 2 protein [Kiritimatiellia bacterium]
MDHSKLTVGVPVYNAERFLERCLENLCAEDFEYKIIISDNASTDGTEKIARKFADKDHRITYVRQESNIGAEKNFMFLLENADTEMFAWRAYDDLSSPDYFKKLSLTLIDNPQSDLAVGCLAYESEGGSAPPRSTMPDALPIDIAQRRMVLLKRASPSWIYGVFRRDELLKRYVDARNAFDYVWSLDNLVILPFLLKGSVSIKSDVFLKAYLCNSSASHYRPKGVIDASRLVLKFWRHGFCIADEVADSFCLKVKLYMGVVRYADGRAEKYRRIVKRALFWPYYKVAGRL